MDKIAVTTTSFAKFNKEPLEILEKNNYEVIMNPYGRKVNKDEIIKLCKDVVGIIAGTEHFDCNVLEQLPCLRVISRCGAGLDGIDLATSARLGMKVFNTPDAPTLAVAELTVGLIFNLLRKINQMDALIRKGKWEKLIGNLIYGKKVGIIGFGRIGNKVAQLLKLFGCEIAYADPFVENRLSGLRRFSLEELLRWADIVSIHVSSNEKILGKKEFLLLKEGAWLVNVSRGVVVDEIVLYEYLKSGYLSGAAVDVFKNEPYYGELSKLDNIILSPHIGSYAKEARVEIERQAVNNLLKGLRDIRVTGDMLDIKLLRRKK